MSDVYIQTNERSNPLTAISLGSLCVVGVFAILPLLQGLGKLAGTTEQVPVITAQDVLPEKVIDIVEQEKPKEPEVDIVMNKPPPLLNLTELEILFNPSSGGVRVDANLNGIYDNIDTTIPEYRTIDLDKKPRVIAAIKPLYPYSMKGVSGNVMVEFVIDENGKVLRARVTESTNYEFNQAAVQAVKRSKWKPGEIGGKAVRTIVKISVAFNK